MAKGTSASGRQMLIKLGDAGSPEEFSAPCGVTSRGLEQTLEVNASTSPDCDNPAAVPYQEQEPVSRSWGAPISGRVLKEAWPRWQEFHAADDATNVEIDLPFADGTVFRYTGAAYLTGLTFTGEDGDKVTFEATLTGHGPLIFVAAT